MADALVQANVVTETLDFGFGRGRNRVVFQNPRGNKYYYCFYVSGDTDPSVITKLICEYSTDGISWSNSQQTIVSFTPHATAIPDFDVKIFDSGSDLDVFLVFYDKQNFDLTYIRGNLSDSGTTITWETPQDIDAGINQEIDNEMSVAIARTDNGRLVVVFTEDWRDMGKNYRQTKIIGADGDGAAPTWSDETMIDDPSPGGANNQNKSGVYLGMESFSSSYPNRVLIYARIPEGSLSNSYVIKLWVYDWAGSSFSEQTTDVPVTPDSQNSYFSAIIDDDDKVHLLVYRSFATNFVDHFKYPTAGGLGTETKYDISEGTIDALTLTLDRTNDELYAFYHHIGDTTTTHYKKTAVGTISWGGEQDITTTDTPVHLSSWNSDVESYLHLAYVDDDGDIYYYGLSLTPPVAAVINKINGVLASAISKINGVTYSGVAKVNGVSTT